ncbi:hypothetical protein, conserved [Eimeria acervulina]|uniref:Plus3 domain-containing protein n=1 Tax=Eimeria acervulina TaxID=5801 RepID=U6GW57_EIMAC|nr:hypothetical protein, conserved [Eimeria acervulina]CDI84491.1 hypothetical protein, conserved [Eimeria acervulina]
MKRAKRRTESSGGGSFAAFDAESLYRDASDKKALESLNEFQREAELARRYEEVARRRQREELLQQHTAKDGRLEALSDIRARRARMKQLQTKASDSSSEGSSEEGEIVVGGGSEMEISGDEGIDGEETIPASSRVNEEQTDTAKQTASRKRPAARAEEGEGSLFAEDRNELGERQRSCLSTRLLSRLSLQLVNRVWLSVVRIHHILGHPSAVSFLSGCIVKVSPPQPVSSSVSSSLPPATYSDPLVCLIVGLRACEPYYCMQQQNSNSNISSNSSSNSSSNNSSSSSNSGGLRCTYTLVLRPTPRASAKYDREFKLNELVDCPVTLKEFQCWVKKLQQFETAEDIAKQMKLKIQQLEKFTYTDEDVQEILRGREETGGLLQRARGGLLKELVSLKHQIASVMECLSSSRTSSSKRQELKETLLELQNKKDKAEAELIKSSSNAAPFLSPHAHTDRENSKKATRVLAAAAAQQQQQQQQLRHGANAVAPTGVCGVSSSFSGLSLSIGETQQQQQQLVAAYVSVCLFSVSF